jgi:sensor histidine kinase YesM
VAIAISLLFIKNWYKKQHENQLLAQKNKEAELSLVKAQLNPHFLFNTLNNLYSLASNKSQEVPNVILQLSDLLNYVLYDCNSKWVSLNKEIYFLKNYVELEKLRYGSRLTFEFITKGDFEKIAIAPMVLITFVENCFKHGVSKVRVNPFVKISISRNKQMLYFEAENSTPRANAEKEYPYQESIGLKNTKMRLDFLYHNNYELKIDKENHVFKVTLKIPLHEKV